MMTHPINPASKDRVIPIWSLVLWSNLIGFGLLSSSALKAEALPVMENAASTGIESPLLQNVFVPPNDDVPEGSRTRGAAARGPSCSVGDQRSSIKTMAILPDTNYGQTLKARPVFLVYVSELPANARNLFFHIRDEQGENVYGTFLPIESNFLIESNTNILRVQLPEDAPFLDIGQRYKWSVAIPCSGDLEPDTPYVSGWIERMEDETSIETTALSSLETVYQYGQAGLWYDMMALLDELYRAEPQDTSTVRAWRNALQWTRLNETLGTLQ